ncbi:PLP-dependent aminotransferase family protein [Streptomyces platensis]|uniref:aminotransferase-like domain-containing protein n=1 Tax=Streptomyces platensis TaxID=58346 RepID=UPI002E253A03|nr:PLP-dependent aminotransferase family protein [Streptomyces platensis]WUB84581.1 PLP-dependent aminotransferase family protein [Streptomyces platensis]
MTFLNEVSHRYPKAISFAAGRPYEGFFAIEDVHRYIERYCAYLKEERGFSDAEVRRALFQYGRTKGIIHELIARNLELDEAIRVDPESVVVTVGCQEAMVTVLRALRTDERDVLMMVSPSYVGITGAARLVDMRVATVVSGDRGVDFESLDAVIRETRENGLRPRALYVVPDYSNPTGQTLSEEDRRRLLHRSRAEGFLILEDNPYGLFHGVLERQRTIKALDRDRRVVYLGSFAKTGLPGARVGYVVADQIVTGGVEGTQLLADQLAKIKSMVTVNTSPIAQAVVAGRLLENDCSLVEANRRETALYQDNMRCVQAALERHFADIPGVSWNRPDGGLFIVVDLPFAARDDELEHCAQDHDVIWTPMAHFGSDKRSQRQIRLSVSQLSNAEIDLGVERLRSFVDERSGSTE